MAEHRHVLPVDPSLTPAEAAEEIRLMRCRATNTGEAKWAVMRCDGGDRCPRAFRLTDVPADYSL